jgi:chromosome segregation ATPase
MGQSPSVQNQQSSESPSGDGAGNSQAEQIRRLQAALVQATANESSLKNEIETLKTSLTHALSSEREMRTSARDTREEWERVERALREEIGVLRNELGKTEKELAKVKKELKGRKVVPFVQRLIQAPWKGGLVEEMITLEEPDIARAEAEIEGEYVSSFPAPLSPSPRD